MSIVARVRASLVIGSLIGLLIPHNAFAGDPVVRQQVRDVALQAGGTLEGMLMTAEGRPETNRTVYLLSNDEVVAKAVTATDGRFSIGGIRAGVYSLRAGESQSVYRLWSGSAAPPSAASKLLLVPNDGQVVRGGGRSGGSGNLLLVGGLIVAAGVIGGVIGYNIRDDDDAS
jgi:hypothetical protein